MKSKKKKKNTELKIHDVPFGDVVADLLKVPSMTKKQTNKTKKRG